MAAYNGKKTSQRSRAQGGGLSFLTVMLLLAGAIALTLAACAAFDDKGGESGSGKDGGGSGEAVSNTDPETFVYNDEIFTAHSGVRRNEYAAEGFAELDGRLYYTDPATDKSAKTGVDVSSHQESIDWHRAMADGVEFAMIRVGYRGNTEGKLNLDNRFAENMSAAAAAGLPVGVYFYSQAVNEDEALGEIEWVLQQLEGYELQYPLVFDWEYAGSDTRTESVSGEVIDRCAEVFCSAAEEAGYTPMIYFNREMAYRIMNLSKLDKYDFWLAEYDGAPTFFYGFEMLQYSNSGSVDGIEGSVDMVLSFKDY